MAKALTTEHVVNDMVTGDLQCLHCGVTYSINKLFPCPVPCYFAFTQAWINEHRYCKETDRGRALAFTGLTLAGVRARRRGKDSDKEDPAQG